MYVLYTNTHQLIVRIDCGIFRLNINDLLIATRVRNRVSTVIHPRAPRQLVHIEHHPNRGRDEPDSSLQRDSLEGLPDRPSMSIPQNRFSFDSRLQASYHYSLQLSHPVVSRRQFCTAGQLRFRTPISVSKGRTAGAGGRSRSKTIHEACDMAIPVSFRLSPLCLQGCTLLVSQHFEYIFFCL